MNDLIQNILAVISIVIAGYFLIFYVVKKFRNKGCAGACGCGTREKLKKSINK